MNNRIRKLAYSGMFIAISVILTRFFSYMPAPTIRLSFGEIPLILSGIILGPWYGAVTGIIADIIGFSINPMGGAYFPGFTLTAALTGFIPGMLAMLNRNREWSWISLIGIIVLTDLITSLLLNTLWLSIIMGRAFIVLLPTRITARVILMPVYVIAVKTVLKISRQAIPAFNKH